MDNNGVIFQNQKLKIKDKVQNKDVSFNMEKEADLGEKNKGKRKIKREIDKGPRFYNFKLAKIAGFFLLFLSFLGLFYFFLPLISAKIKSQKKKGFAEILSNPGFSSFSTKIEINEKPEAGKQKIIVDNNKQKSDYFYLTIDRIGLNYVPVIANVDATNSQIYQQSLANGLAHAKGTALPGEGRLVYIFGHSANYPWRQSNFNALFYRLNELAPNDKVKIELNGRHYVYYLEDKKIVFSNDLKILEDKMDEDILVLQTCYPPGTALYRLLLFCRPSKMGALI